MSNNTDELVMVNILRDGRKTKMSLDSLLYEWLASRQGGMIGADAWIRRAVSRVEVLLEAGDPLVATGGRIGFSRLIQRLILNDLIEAAGGLGRKMGDGHLRDQAALVEALKEMDRADTESGEAGGRDAGGEVLA